MKTSAFVISLLLLLALAIDTNGRSAAAAKHRLDPGKLQDGDVLFIHSHSIKTETICKVTHSRFSHCGMVFRVNGDWKVYEGAGRGAQYLSLNEWQDAQSPHNDAGEVTTYEPVSVRRLREIQSWPDKQKTRNLAALLAAAKKLHETSYDVGFAWNNHYFVKEGKPVYSTDPSGKEYVYCSELVYKAFARALNIQLAQLKVIGSYALTPEAIEFLNSDDARTARGGKNYDPNEKVVSPQDLFASEKLQDVDAEAR